MNQDPYEAQGSPLRVHHPVQQKTQVERWEEERDNNRKAIIDCCGYVFNAESSKFEVKNDGCDCPKQGTERCSERYKKNNELRESISQATQPIHPRYSTGTFADDKCNCAEISCKVGCKRNHTHKTFSCEKCNPKVTLLDKIKKLLWKYLEK